MSARRASDPDKNEQRRQQVLDAAASCFRREGFHGASMAKISQAAGMSVGHIYHYFSGKEAIVEAIAAAEAHDMSLLLDKLQDDTSGEDLPSLMARSTAEIVQRHCDPERIGLALELASEALRNPKVHAILARSDSAISNRFVRQIENMGGVEGLTTEQVQSRLELIVATFDGLMLRILKNRELDLEEMTNFINEMIFFLFKKDR